MAELYGLHAQMVLGVCRRLLRDSAEAEDAAQQTFLSAQRALQNGSRPHEPAAWLAAIARNECLARSKARMREPLPTEEVPTAHGPDAHTEAMRRTSVEHLRDAIGSLPVQQREAILLREVRGFSYDEIATSLSLSPSAVESLIFRARRGVQLRLRNAWAALSPFGWFTSLRELFVQLAAGGDPGAGPLAVKAATIGLGTAVIAGSAFFGPQALHGNRAHAVRASAASTIAPAGHVKLPSRPAVAPTVLPTNSRPTASSPAAPATHRAPVVGRQLRGPDDTRELQRPAGVLLLRSRTTAAHELGDVAEPGDGAAVTRATTAAASPQSPTDDGPDSSSGGPDD